MPVETGCSSIFSVHHDSYYRQRRAGVCYLATGICQKNRAQALPLIRGGDSKPPYQRHRHGISRQLLRQRFRQPGTINTACAQRKKSCQMVRVVFGRGHKYARYIQTS